MYVIPSLKFMRKNYITKEKEAMNLKESMGMIIGRKGKWEGENDIIIIKNIYKKINSTQLLKNQF